MTRGQVGSRLSVWTVNLRGLELESTNKMNSVGANITHVGSVGSIPFGHFGCVCLKGAHTTED
jgi:hypothetical protein